jgi:hypothetical protein
MTSLSDDQVSVRVEWHETAKYSTTIQMPRADYERLRTQFLGDKDEVEDLEGELMVNRNLTRVEATDWDDLELDVFVEDTPDDDEASEPDDPSDPDGECYRGGEYAASVVAELEAARRLK